MIRPQNINTDSKIDPSLRRRRMIHENNSARNKRFQLPLIPTANQIVWNCSNSQSALRPKSGRSEHKLVSLYQAQLLAVAVRENVWEPLKLGLISGYDVKPPNLTFYGGRGHWIKCLKIIPGKVACIWHIEVVQTDSSKFERTQIHFFSDVFTAVVLVVAWGP